MLHQVPGHGPGGTDPPPRRKITVLESGVSWAADVLTLVVALSDEPTPMWVKVGLAVLRTIARLLPS